MRSSVVTVPRADRHPRENPDVTRPTARVLALLEVLQRGGTRTATDLAEQLGVDERTIRRYVEHLVDLDIPVRPVRGRYGGYRLAPGYRMPPLMLTDEEALAVLLGLVVGRRSALVSAPLAALESAAAKVRRVLPQALGARLDALLETVEVTTPARPTITAETAVLLTLAQAARDRRPVALAYTRRDGRESERILHPYGIVAHSDRWYVTGADSASGEIRTFRLDRIRTTTVLSGAFDVPIGFDPAARVLAGIAQAPHRYAVSVQVEGAAEDVRRRWPSGIATVEELTADRVRVQLRAEQLDWVAGVLAGLNRPFVIETPDALRDQVRALARRLTDHAEARPAPS
jgi:predicted DNA-binding transcriptional regulator YafY